MQIHRAAIEHPGRPPEDRARDASAKPHEVLGFMAAAPGMTILDFQAGTGYFTELLSRVVGDEGKVFAHGHPGNAVLGPEVFERRYGDARLPNVQPVFARHDDLKLDGASLDAVLMSMVYHDTYWHDEKVDWGPVNQQALLGAVYRALRPGGTVLVIDHRAEDGSDPYRTAMATHRIDPAVVVRDFTDAGFGLAAESDALANAEDTLDTGIFEPGVYRNTDRFMLLFAKP